MEFLLVKTTNEKINSEPSANAFDYTWCNGSFGFGCRCNSSAGVGGGGGRCIEFIRYTLT